MISTMEHFRQNLISWRSEGRAMADGAIAYSIHLVAACVEGHCV